MTAGIIVVYLFIILYAAIVDYKKLIVRDRVHVMIGILAMIRFQMQNMVPAILGAIVFTLPFLIIAVKTNQIGGGDIKFIFTNCMFLRFSDCYFGTLMGLMSVIIIHCFLKLRKYQRKNRKIPLAPYLSLGYFLNILCDQLLFP